MTMTICSKGDVITTEHAYEDILNTAEISFTRMSTGKIRYSEVVGISDYFLIHSNQNIEEFNQWCYRDLMLNFMKSIVETQTLLFLHQETKMLNDISLQIFLDDVLSLNSSDYIKSQDSPDEIFNVEVI